MQYLYGKPIAKQIYSQLQDTLESLSFVPSFTDIMIGNDPVLNTYVTKKEQQAKELGISVVDARLAVEITEEQVISKIRDLSQDPTMCGLVLQLPIPGHLSYETVSNAIPPELDVDVLRPKSQEEFYSGNARYIFPTARAVMRLIEELPPLSSAANIVIIGDGMLVGSPVSYLLRQRKHSVTTITKKTSHPEAYIREADLLISAAGSPGLVTKEKVKEGVMLIDAGTATAGGKITGDVDIDSVKQKASYLAPVPGGVGPLTVAMLLSNVVKEAERKSSQ